MHLSFILTNLLAAVTTTTVAEVSSSSQSSHRLRLATFNIRYDAPKSQREANEKPWTDRAPLVIQTLANISSAAPTGSLTVIGLQEVLDNQLSDILSGLGPPWTHFGVGRDDGARAGEYSPILYRTDQLTPLYAETRWLSPTPDVPSKGWGAGSRRVVSIVVFETTDDGSSSKKKKFIHANTHLDNVSGQARREGVKIVLDRIKALVAVHGGGGPAGDDDVGVSLTGDFNSAPGADAFKTLADTGYMTGEMFDLAGAEKRVGAYQATYTGFSDAGLASSSRIDFVWLGPAAGRTFEVTRYEIWGNKVGGVFISDHRPVVGDARLL